MCVFLLLWDRRGRFTRPSALADYGHWKYIHSADSVHHQLGECNAADDAHNHEKERDAYGELEECLLKSTSRTLNGFATATELTPKCRTFGLQQE